MIIQPKVRGFICTTAHPDGCAKHVEEQIRYVQSKPPIDGPKKALIIGASTGFGLSTRIAAAFGAGAATLGVFFERSAEGNRTATAGWYNTAAFTREARRAGLYAENINGDAFSDAVKEQVIETIRRDLGQVDLVVYSLAAPRRTDPRTGEVYGSVLKPIGQPYTGKTVDVNTGKVTDVTLEPATEEEIRGTVAVMGGEDWRMWIDALLEAGVLAEGAVTVAYSYVGPAVTRAIYRDGTIGRAKDDLERSAREIDGQLGKIGGRAFVSVNKALVTQASSAIPIVPLYISLLFKIMKEKGVHEGTIEQMYRLLAERLYAGGEVPVDELGRIRIDDLELREDVQKEVEALWPQVDTDNLPHISDIAGYRADFLKLFGFGFDGVDYEADVNPDVPING
jgi:enoyl-[acyl-carrier protein] reductase/trans-2-enoyl-CoA reductase (NAD+)